MFRAAVRTAPRALRETSVASASGRRFASTAPAATRYTWKGTAARWGLAVGALYWYNTSPIFADEMPSRLSAEPPQFPESDLPTVDVIVEEKRRQLDAKLKAKEEQAAKAASQTPPPTKNDSTAVAAPGEAEKSPEQLEEEAGQQGAFNPETGEINWDCPCLGGMAHGPCGEEFKAAFSCFVYSKEEPKGMDCIDKFQHMQDCFRKYPDVYGEEIADEEAAEAEAEADAAAAAAASPAPAAKRDAATSEPAPATSSDSAKPKKSTVKSEKAVPAHEKPAESKDKPAEAPKKEEHKASPTDAPKTAQSTSPSAASEASQPVGKGDVKEEAPKDELEWDPRGLPKRSFDATSANTSGSK